MAEKKDKSLDDQIKEAELEKLKAEAALVRKQINARWYSGKSLGQIAAVALTVTAVYTGVDQIFLTDLKQKEARLAKVETGLFQAQVDSLNRYKASIITTIDSLFLRSQIFKSSTPEEFENALKQSGWLKRKATSIKN